ncbi:MAG: hypothetical protein ACO2ON_00695 [Candidatus Nanopusillus sp.]
MERFVLKYIGNGISDFSPFEIVPLEKWDKKYYIEQLGFIKDKGFVKFGEGITTWGSIIEKKKNKKALVGIAYDLESGESAYAGFLTEIESDMYEFVDCKTVKITLKYIVRKEILTIYKIKKTLNKLKEWLPNYKEFKKILESLALGYVLYKSIKGYPIKITSFNFKEFYYYLYTNDLKGELDQNTYLEITKIYGETNKIKDINYILDLAERFVKAREKRIIKE